METVSKQLGEGVSLLFSVLLPGSPKAAGSSVADRLFFFFKQDVSQSRPFPQLFETHDRHPAL